MCDKIKYSKPPLTIDQQCEQLEKRGLIISDKDYAKSILLSIGYYRLSAYFLPFQENKKKHIFYPDVKFEQVVNVYKFDCQLRSILLIPIESAEVRIRTKLTYELAIKYNDPFCYLNKEIYSPKFLGQQIAREDLIRELRHLPDSDISLIWGKIRKAGFITKKGIVIKTPLSIEEFTIDLNPLEIEAVYNCLINSTYKRFTHSIHSSESESQEEFVRHFGNKYLDEHLPIWMVTEIVSLGMISRLFSGLNSENKQEIAANYNLAHRILSQWLHSLTYLRNMCAHHSRLWNRYLEIAPTRPRTLPEAEVWNKKLFSLLVVLKYLVSNSFDWEEFISNLENLLNKNKFIDTKAMGFPDDWKEWLLKLTIENG